MTKEKYTDVAKYDLESCLRELGAQASLNGVSRLAMLRIGVVDDRLECTNVAICLDLIFKMFTVPYLIILPKQKKFLSTPQENNSGELNRCAVVTPEEVLLTKSVTERISWTRSDSKLAKRQRADSAIKIITLALEGYVVNLGDSHCTFGTNPISKEEALSCGNLESLEQWSNWEYHGTSNGVLYRKWKTSNRVDKCWQAISPKEMRNGILYQLQD